MKKWPFRKPSLTKELGKPPQSADTLQEEIHHSTKAKWQFENEEILGLNKAYKEIFATKRLIENISKLNGSFKNSALVKEVIEFITKDKKRSICTPFS